MKIVSTYISIHAGRAGCGLVGALRAVGPDGAGVVCAMVGTCRTIVASWTHFTARPVSGVSIVTCHTCIFNTQW